MKLLNNVFGWRDFLPQADAEYLIIKVKIGIAGKIAGDIKIMLPGNTCKEIAYLTEKAGMNTITIIIVSVTGAAVVGFLLYRNIRDARKYRKQLTDDYHKTADKEKDVELPGEL